MLDEAALALLANEVMTFAHPREVLMRIYDKQDRVTRMSHNPQTRSPRTLKRLAAILVSQRLKGGQGSANAHVIRRMSNLRI